jgi:hypothetical protein
MNKEAPRTEEWIDRHGRGVLLNHRLRQTQHPDWSAPDQIQRKKPETPVKPTRIRLNYEPNAGKSARRTLEPMNNDPSGKSRISSEQAAAMFDFDGKLNVAESSKWGDPDQLSRLVITPQDGSFDNIGITIAKGGTLYNESDMESKTWVKDPGVQEVNPLVPIAFPNGAKGYFDRDGNIVLSSPDGLFDIGIEITISQTSRDAPVITNSNKRLLDGLLDKGDHGLKFLTAIMSKLYPLAKEKYHEQISARAEIGQATTLLAKESATTPLPTETVQPSPSSVSPSPLATVTQPSQSTSPVFYAIAALVAIVTIVFIVVWMKKAP